MEPLCETLRTAHSQPSPILHRDLKPDNVIVRELETADLVVIDYGLSFNADQETGITQTGETFKNKFCDLPEANTPGGNRRDSRSDVTLACAVFYFMLTGHVPGQLLDAGGRSPHMRPGHSLREALKGADPRLHQLEQLFKRRFEQNINDRFGLIEELLPRLNASVQIPDSTTIEEPADVASRLSEQLRKEDRATQLKLFSTATKKVFGKLTIYADQERPKLKPDFALTFNLHPAESKRSRIPSFTNLSNNELVVALKLVEHNNRRSVVYGFVADGLECVLLQRQRAAAVGEKQE